VILLNPGPVTLSERVRRSLLNPDLCHREPEFFDLQDEIRRGLLAVYGLKESEWIAVLMTGSGTAAVESMLASVPHAGARVLVLDNGVYGERMTQMCAQYGIAHETIKGPWQDAPDLGQIGARLAPGGFTHLAVVHHETTTGRLTDINELGRLCAAQGVQMLLDGVSSFGAEAIDFTAPLAAVAATANKCLHGVPGVSFVIARRTALRDAVSRTYYLDLGRLARLQDQRNTPFTPAVHVYYGLQEALREYQEQGGRSRAPSTLRSARRTGAFGSCAIGHCGAARGLGLLGGPACLSSTPGHQLPGAARCAQGRRLCDLCGTGRSVAHAVSHFHHGGDPPR
jgi:2-aminoethylphosphonate-pyruvate transaminase